MALLAQENISPSISAQVDLVSRYVWRGQEYGQSPSIQPDLSVSWNNYSLGVWGAYKTTGAGIQETDLYIAKSFNHFYFSILDYYSFNDTISNNFFDYKESTTSHVLEVQMMVYGTKTLPFNILGSYMFYGADPSRSIYFELQYEYFSENFNILLFAGYQAKGNYYGDKPDFVNLGCTVSKSLKVSESWALPMDFSFIVNPNINGAYLVAGITL